VKKFFQFVTGRFFTGLLVLTPIYLATLLLLKAAQSLSGLVKPLVKLIPETDWLPAEGVLSLLLVLLICFLVGVATQTRKGQAFFESIEEAILSRIPGYELIRSLIERISGQAEDNAWKPALAEIEDALVPAFIIETLPDGRLTVFVPSIPTPLAGAIYILVPSRVHPLDIPFTQMLRSVTKWGSGSNTLVAAMEASGRPSAQDPT
jgi:uncharacterized membrane protein